MTAALAIVGWILFIIALAVGLALDAIGFFGNWVILGAVVIAWLATGFVHWNAYIIAGLFGLAVLGEVLEVAASGYGAKRFGGSRGAVIAALVGCLVGGFLGTPWFPVVGTIAGACGGAFAGATLFELLLMEKDLANATKAGFGAALGKIIGMAIKIGVGIAMIGVLILGF